MIEIGEAVRARQHATTLVGMSADDDARTIRDDPRLRLRPLQRLFELARPWVLVSLYVALVQHGFLVTSVVVALGACLAAFVQMHDALHESLGLGKRGHAIVLSLSALLILKSGHALKATHLRHHGRCLGEDDPEGAPANWSLARVLLSGPFHILALRREALRIAPRTRAIQYVETAATVLVLVAATIAYVRFHVIAGVVYWGVAAFVSSTMPLWAAYIPHRLASRNPSIRAAARVAQVWTPIVNSFAFHHLHHRFPKVPTALLPRAAERAGACEAHDHLS